MHHKRVFFSAAKSNVERQARSVECGFVRIVCLMMSPFLSPRIFTICHSCKGSWCGGWEYDPSGYNLVGLTCPSSSPSLCHRDLQGFKASPNIIFKLLSLKSKISSCCRQFEAMICKRFHRHELRKYETSSSSLAASPILYGWSTPLWNVRRFLESSFERFCFAEKTELSFPQAEAN